MRRFSAPDRARRVHSQLASTVDLNLLKSFVAVADSGSFSRAAEALHTTQPAVSKRIAALEADLGVQLLDRLGRQSVLTEAGETLLVSARRILADLHTSREQLRTLSGAVAGRLRLATSHHVGIHRLPPVLKAFSPAYPGVELDLLFMDSEQACARVLDGTLELAIVTLPEVPVPSLDTRVIWPDPLAIVCAPNHPLAIYTIGHTAGRAGHAGSSGAPGSLSPAQLCRHAAILPGEGTVTRRILLNALAPYSVIPATRLETNYLETIKMMVSVGLGWSVLPASMLDDNVLALRLPQLNMQRDLGTVQRRGRSLTRAAAAFLSLLPDPNQT